MQIKNLKGFPLVELVDCLLKSFEGYYVKMPSDLQYWARRFRGARVDRIYSFGVFEGWDLRAFMVQGIDQYRGARTVFNTGTGVLPSFRGQHLVDKMYEAFWPVCEENEVTQCALEVIQENHKAIRVYERNGFEISRELKSYSGVLKGPHIPLHLSPIQELPQYANDEWVSWDFTRTAMLIRAFDYQHFEVQNAQNKVIGSFSIDSERKLLARMDIDQGNYLHLLSAVRQLYPEVRMVNVDSRNEALVDALLQFGMENTINQFEMTKKLN